MGLAASMPSGILLLLSLAIVIVIVGLAAARYDNDHAEGSSRRCDLFESIGHGDSYHIESFPPEPRYPLRMWPYTYLDKYKQLPLSPEQCTWEFEVDNRDHDQCVLEFRSHDFERGDIECEHQYLLIGDEYGEKKICGFSKPPVRFTSSGKKLFLGHYRRNGRYQTLPSRLDGVVGCVNRLVQNYNYVNNSTPPPCPPPTDPICTNSTLYTAFATTTVQLSFGPAPNNETAILLSDIQAATDSTGQTNACFQTSPSGCNFTATGVDPFTTGSNITCTNATVAICAHSGPCNADGITGSATGVQVPLQAECPASSNRICTWTTTICLQPKP